MKIKSISAQQIYRLKVSGRPVPSQPKLDEVITDGRGNWGVDWGDEWSWGYGSCQGFKELESSFQKQLAGEPSSEPRGEIPKLPLAEDEIWDDDLKSLFGLHPDRHLPRSQRRTASDDIYIEGSEELATRVDFGVTVERLYDVASVEIEFCIYLNWLPVPGTYIDAGMDFVHLDFFEDPQGAWTDQIYPRIRGCYESALKETQSIILALSSDEGSQRMSKELKSFRPEKQTALE